MQVPAHEIVAISSSTSSDSGDNKDNKPYEDDRHFDVVYDADKILGERLRPINAEHAAMCRVEVDTMCTHYLVKWAGYPTSHSTWTPVSLCSRNLVDLYLQQNGRLTIIPSREPRYEAELDDDVPGENPLPPPDNVAPPSGLPLPVISVSSTAPGVAQFAAQDVHTHETLKALLANLNEECEVRIRGRDRKRDIDTVRLGCKHVKGMLPCALQLYYDIKNNGVISNIRRYSRGSCASSVCAVCNCLLKHEKFVYDGCHRFCQNCISHVVTCGVRGEGAPLFVASREIPCGLCKLPLDVAMAAPLLLPDATRAYQEALCTIASLESEKITEIRLRSACAAVPPQQDPTVAILEEIATLILPFCPVCKRTLPDFDGCCALQCGNLNGIFDRALGCGAHLCAWCQHDFIDGHACHQHVSQCLLNPGDDLYPPKPHPQTWYSVHRQVGRNRVWLKVCNHGNCRDCWCCFLVAVVAITVYLFVSLSLEFCFDFCSRRCDCWCCFLVAVVAITVYLYVSLCFTFLQVTSSGWDASIWPKIQAQWPELFVQLDMPTYLKMMNDLSTAAEQVSTADHFLANVEKYIQV